MKLLKIQNNIKEQFKRSKSNFNKSPKEKLTKSYLETRLQLIDAKWTDFTKNHYELLQNEEILDTSYIKDGTYDEMEEFYLEFKSELTELIDSSFNTNVCIQSNLKLPKLVIPVFSGQYSQWVTFRSLFISLVHNNTSLDAVQKLHYLKGHLSGEAEQLLRHIPITDDNYLRCWTMLEKRYDNKQYLVNCMLNEFFYKKKIPNESATGIKDLLNCTLDMLNGMKGLGVNVESWDILVIYIVSLKLDQESRKLWESNVSKLVSESNSLPNFTNFKKFLENRFHSLEFLDLNANDNDHKQANTGYSKIVTMLGTQILCSYCKENHKLSNCKDFSKLECNNKHRFVQENRICFNCLTSNHPAKYCRSINCCRICNRRHHSLLHPYQLGERKKVLDTESCRAAYFDSSEVGLLLQEQDVSPLSSNVSKGNLQHVLLQTALVSCDSSNGDNQDQTFRALIDQGSQASFVTETVVQQLGLKKESICNRVAVLGQGNSVATRAMVTLNLKSHVNNDYIKPIKAYVINKITHSLPINKVQVSWPALRSVKLADPDYGTPNRIDILLGAGVYGSLVRDGLMKSPSGATIAQNTALGWVVSGEV